MNFLFEFKWFISLLDEFIDYDLKFRLSSFYIKIWRNFCVWILENQKPLFQLEKFWQLKYYAAKHRPYCKLVKKIWYCQRLNFFMLEQKMRNFTILPLLICIIKFNLLKISPVEFVNKRRSQITNQQIEKA